MLRDARTLTTPNARGARQEGDQQQRETRPAYEDADHKAPVARIDHRSNHLLGSPESLTPFW